MLSPKRTKYRKPHRGRLKGKAMRGNTIAFGDFALQALEPGWITSRQIEAGRRAMSRYARRGGKLWIRVFPDKSITARAAETRMGAGKGAPDYWVAVVKPGKILYEMRGVSEAIARSSMRISIRIAREHHTKRDICVCRHTWPPQTMFLFLVPLGLLPRASHAACMHAASRARPCTEQHPRTPVPCRTCPHPGTGECTMRATAWAPSRIFQD